LWLAAGLLLAAGPAGCKSKQEAAQARALDTVSQLGGEVEVDRNRPGRPVIKVLLGNTRTTDDDLAALQPLDALEELYLSRTDVTDDGLPHLAGLTNLRILTLASTRVSDRGLVNLEGLKALRWLDLEGALVTDAGLVHLEPLTALENLYLGRTAVSDERVEVLRKARPQLTVHR
jgi:hypothetical protein